MKYTPGTLVELNNGLRYRIVSREEYYALYSHPDYKNAVLFAFGENGHRWDHINWPNEEGIGAFYWDGTIKNVVDEFSVDVANDELSVLRKENEILHRLLNEAEARGF